MESVDLGDLAAGVLRHQRSTPDLIADALREAIVQGVFQEGQSLRQDEIAAQFGVSRIPLREALRQLEAEGLVLLSPNRGATVAIMSPAEAQEIGEIRVALESLALQLAIPKLTEADLQKAADILEKTDRETDVGRWAKLNWEFHAVLYGAGDRPRLLSLIKTLHVNIDRYIRLQMAKMNYLEKSQQEHQQILDACRKGDSKTAVRLLKRHIETAGEQLVTYLRNGR
ncbi:GntR family transcriptional regulator [Leptolyngbya sp. FACHB-671]|uniref:GntR family transcriptional regulator n=1 Tax=Leptolyngbya sp. FACHB-671 TaxID=2692812 RepID=UPI001689DF8B|nr:GntR family transcriptional regulator [Leptolyngbya sp. FACHB-671]MBD2070188.1 GntR family transcriptional regulator [Leptolyngbya sp. FACHB-671]